MRASIVVAAHNEGQRLSRTLAACVDGIVDLDYEIVVVDDASFDGSVEAAAGLFPQIRTVRNETRAGVSATKARGAQEARGDVIVFLDGHTKPTQGAIERLVGVVERLNRDAVVTPQVVALDEQRWELDHSRVGNGYFLDLLTLDCGWRDLSDLRPVRESGLLLYESPALIGCALAVDRALYAKLHGFDPHMRSWGVEDLDFGLKTWLLGHRILHDPQAVVGHRFRDTFDDYDVRPDDVLHNQIRTAVKNFSHTVAADWLEACRQRNDEPLDDHPEGLWARAWQLFGERRGSAEQERGYLHARQVRDEIWYARRFGLDWPRLTGAEPGGPVFLAASPGPSRGPSRGPSPSPAPCSVTGITPNTATIATGVNQKFTAQGSNLANVAWTTSPAGTPATGQGSTFTTKWTASGATQVRASCGSSNATANVTVVAITPVLTPADNFTGRSTTRFGVGEVVALSFTATPTATAAALGGLRWFITSGGGALTGTGNAGTATYTAAATAGSTTLQLKIASGAATGTVVATKTITIVAPTNMHMTQAPGTNIFHIQNTWSIGFKGAPFLRPTDVSFRNAWITEGAVNAVASGYLASLNGTPHTPTATGIPCLGGNATTGTPVNAVDTIGNGLTGMMTAPYSNGDFLWAIPWRYGITQTTATTQFTTANHHATSDATGKATITKKDAGPFSRVPSDPTSGF